MDTEGIGRLMYSDVTIGLRHWQAGISS